MGCGCKTNSFKDTNSNNLNNKPKDKSGNSFSNILVKILAFSLMMLLLPFIMLVIIWFVFDLIILNREIDMKKIIRVLSSKIKPFNEGYEENNYDDYEDEDEEDEFTEENYESVDVEDITPIAIK